MNSIGSPSQMAESHDAHDLARYGFLAFVGAAVLWLVLGAWQISEYMRYTDYDLHPEKAPAGIPAHPTELIFFSSLLAGIFIAFAIAALILAIVVRVSVLRPMARQEHEMAARYMPNLSAMGFLFGLGAAGYLLRQSFKKLRETRIADMAPQMVTSVAEATPVCPVCGNAATFIHGQQRWHCASCARFL
jgi:ribosomal protein S27AE